MITLKVDRKKYEIDSDPTVDQWMEMMKWDFESPVHWPYIIKAVTDLEFFVINEMTKEQQHLAVVMIGHALLLRKQTKLPDFESVTFGTFVDLEYYLTMGTNKTMKQMLAALNTPTDSAQEALWIIENWIKWRNNIYKNYAGLFNLDELDIDDEEPKSITPQKVASDWYRIIVELANDDVLKIDNITNKKVKEIFNFMSVRKEKQLAEMRAQKQQKQKYDLQRHRR